jgi:Zn-dependent alcohol dehydrogenase
MKSKAAVLHHQPGICATPTTTSPRATFPFAGTPVAGGHEGAGIVEEAGPHTPGWNVGDNVVPSFLPSFLPARGPRAACRVREH